MVSTGLMAAPASAGAATSDPLGPTVTQVEAFANTAVANGQATYATLLNDIEGILAVPGNLGLTNLGCVLGAVAVALGKGLPCDR